MTLTQIAEALSAPISSCHGLVRTLSARGYLYTSERNRAIYPTKRLLEIANTIAAHDPVLESIVPELEALRDATNEFEGKLYDATGLKVGAVFTHVFQGVSHSIDRQDEYGTATTLDMLGAWDLIHKDRPTLGQLVAHGQGRWEEPAQSWRAAHVLGSKGIPNRVDPWGEEYDHDWPTWRSMLPHYLAELA